MRHPGRSTRHQLVHSIIARAADDHPDNLAVRDPHGEWRWRELWRRSGAAAGWLQRRGVQPGDRVLLALENSREFVALLCAVLRAGAIAVPVPAQFREAQLAHIVRDCSPALAVLNADLSPCAGLDVTAVPVAQFDAESQNESAPPAVAVDPGDTALLLYTSGTTSSPRGVVCPHEKVVFAATAIAGRLGYRATDVVHCRLPFAFDYTLYQILLAGLAGAGIAVADGFPEAATLRMIRRLGATVVPVVPTMATIMSTLASRDRRPTSVRLFTNTGAELTAEHTRRLRAAFPDADIVSMYGMTECKRITIAAPDADLQNPGTVGTALPGTRLEVVGEDGRPAGTGETGEVVVHGPHVMDGYWNAPRETALRFRRSAPGAAPALYTGDFGWLDADGELHLLGRRDDIVKRRGVRVSTNEIEAAAMTVPGVVAACVLPEVPGTGLVLCYAGTVTPGELYTALDTRLDPPRQPDLCVSVPNLPRTTNGKMDRSRLAELITETGRGKAS